MTVVVAGSSPLNYLTLIGSVGVLHQLYGIIVDAASRARRLEWTADGTVWYADEPRGYLGRINPATGETKEWLMPGGASSRPHALTKDGQGRLWISESGPTRQLVGFDPRTERFFSVSKVSGVIRHMFFDQATGMMWFGTGSTIGRIATRTATS